MKYYLQIMDDVCVKIVNAKTDGLARHVVVQLAKQVVSTRKQM
jgi:hypothetical protein